MTYKEACRWIDKLMWKANDWSPPPDNGMFPETKTAEFREELEANVSPALPPAKPDQLNG